MRVSRKIWIAFVLAICAAMSLLPGTATAADRTFSEDTSISTTSISTDTIWTVEDGVTVTVGGTITVRSGATLTLQGGGTFLRYYTGSNGMFYVNGGTLIIDGVTIDGNGNNITAASKSNAIKIEGTSGSCLMKSGSIQNCKQETFGAAIYVSSFSSFTMEGGTIRDNTMTSATSDYGGAGLYNLGTSTINGGIFTGNSATRGGAIYNASSGKLTVNGGEIYDNTATKNDGSGLPFGDSVFHSSKDSEDGQLYLGGAADIRGDIYLDNASASKFVYLTGALRHPMTVTCGEAVEGRVVVQGSDYTVTAQDMARLSIKNSGWYFGLSDADNQIFITASESEAYIPITIESDDGSLDVTLNQSVTLDYSEAAGGYIGSVPAGTYDVYVGGADTGNDIAVSVIQNVFDSSVLLAPHVHSIDSGMESTTFAPLSSLETTLGEGSYYLAKNLTNDTGDHITVSGDVTLCLNGKTLDLNGYHIIVPTDASLTLCDCGSGEITGQNYTYANKNGNGSVYVLGGSFTMYSGSITGNNAYSGGAVNVDGGGSFVMHGGTISGNTAQLGGGVSVISGSFAMYGGTISGNGATTYGYGGVYVDDDSSFTMYDGYITNNQATGTSGSGGVQVNGSFTMSGGEISGNTAHSSYYGGGVHVAHGGSFTISGDASITGNTAGGSDCNVYLYGNAVITIGDKLIGGKIGVKMEKPGTFTSGWNTIMGDAAPSGYFTSEDSDYLVARNSDGEAMLHQHSYTYTADGDTITESCACGHSETARVFIPAGADLTYTGNAITPAEVDYSTGWLGGELTPTYDNNTAVGTATAKITIDTATASVTFEITRAAQSAPASGEGYVIDYAEETITVDSGYEVYTDTSATVRVESGSKVVPGTTYYIRKAGTDTQNPSDFTAFTVTTRPATPAAPTVTDRTDTSITISAEPGCEYSIDGGSWVSVAGSYTFENLTPGTDYTISVRVAATDGAPVSESAAITVTTKTAPAAPPAEPGGEGSGSAITVTDGSITITGSVSGQEYIVLPKGDTPDESDWTSAQSGNGGDLTFDGLTPGMEYTVWTRSEETDSAMPSQPSQSGVTTAAETPDSYADGMSIDYTEETITVKPGYEISTDGQNWSESAEFTPGETYYVRVQEQGGVPASDSVSFTAPQRPEQPGEAVTVTGETIKDKGDGTINVPSGMEYSTDGGESWTSGPARLTGLPAGSEVIVREQATATTPHGVEQTYTVPASTTTLTVTFDENGGSDVNNITGLSYGATVAAPETKRTGYTLDGWYNGDVKWDFGAGITEDTTLTARWTLDEPTVSLTANKTESTYGESITLTAAPLHAASVSYSYEWYKDGVELSHTDATLTIENVIESGSYTVIVTAMDSDKLTASAISSTVAVTISKANPVTAWPTASAITYGDSLGESKLTGGAAVSGSFAWEDDSVNPTSGSHEYTVVFTPDDGANYNTVKQSVTVQVAQKELAASVDTVDDKVYDGNAETTGAIKLTGAVLNDQPTASGVFTFENANAGKNKTVNVAVTLDGTWGENYVLSTDLLTAKADITPKTVGLEWSGYEGLVYDGEAVSIAAEATGLIGDDTCAVTVENGDEVNAGDYTTEATELSNQNYQLPADVEQDYTIAPRPVVLIWSESGFTYDASEKTVTAEVENRAGDDTFNLKYTGNTGTEAKDYTATVTALGNANYTLTGGSGLTHNWSISKATVSFTVSGNIHTYDGNAKTADVAQTEGETRIPSGGYTVDYGGAENQTEAGSYDITVTITNDNFCFEDGGTSMVVGQLSIGKAVVDVPEADTSKFTYNGQNQTYTIAGSSLYTVTGNTQKNAGSYTVTVALNDRDNYVWSDNTTDDLDYTFTIAKKSITGTWQGLSQVYGDENDVGIILDGLESGDEDIQAVITGTGTDAGSYELTATLDNYEITNSTATLVVQQKPVTVTVTENAVTPGETPEISVPGVPEDDYEVVYRDKDGNEADITKPGSYEIWVEFPEDGNYRHPDGSTEKQVGSITVAETKPAAYTVTFDGNGADEGSMTALELAGGSVLTLPQCGYEKSGWQFTGWLYNGKTYQPGGSLTTAYKAMTFTAQWQQTTGSLSGVVDEAGEPVRGAVVSLWLGANKLAEVPTDEDGTYSFTDLLPGIYNLAVSRGEQTVTRMVEIDGSGKEENVTLPTGITNSVVEVTPGSPDIVVGKLDEVFNSTDSEDYTPEDAAVVENGGKVEITFTADEKRETEVQNELEQLRSAGGSNLSLFLDSTLTKTVTDGNGTTETPVSQSSVLLEVRLPMPTELQGKYRYTVSRIHEGEAQALSTSPNGLGEYFEVNDDKTVLTLHVCCFSTYAIGYKNASYVPDYTPETNVSGSGSYTTSPSSPIEGQKVTIKPKPDEGYEVASVTVTDSSGEPVEVRVNDDGTYSFIQPKGNVTIDVNFHRIGGYANCLKDESCPMSAFDDLSTQAWYHDGVHYCLDEELMNGVAEEIFDPNGSTSRAMIVTLFWRLEGEPEAADGNFSDVSEGAWYADAVNWAAGEGIVTGYPDGSFDPDVAVTREQIAAIIYRYAQYKGYDVSEETDILSYTDADEVSDYAVPAMRWACGVGLITGMTDSALEPTGTATRAQVATILMRFAENLA